MTDKELTEHLLVKPQIKKEFTETPEFGQWQLWSLLLNAAYFGCLDQLLDYLKDKTKGNE